MKINEIIFFLNRISIPYPVCIKHILSIYSITNYLFKKCDTPIIL
jgi:hypothetical protein